jgi:transposase-like protein
MVKQERIGETVILRCDCGNKMEMRERGIKRWKCVKCGFEIPLSSLTPLQEKD